MLNQTINTADKQAAFHYRLEKDCPVSEMPQRKYIATRDGKIAYTETGNGQPVVMLHCSSAAGLIWESLTDSMALAYRCISPDQWGCGNSDGWTGQGGFSLQREADPIRKIIENFEQPVHLVGHSYGGGVALKLARQVPEMIESLVLIEPSVFHLLDPYRESEKPLCDEIRAVSENVNRAIGNGDYWSGMSAFIDYWSGDGYWASLSHTARMRMAQRLGKVALDFMALFDEPATLEDYARIKQRTLVICGENSPRPSRRIAYHLVGAMKNATVARIPGAGHMSPVTHSQLVNEEIRFHIHGSSAMETGDQAIVA